MNTKQIYNILARDGVTNNHFRGVYPIDLLKPKSELKTRYDNFFICNTQKQSEKGEHWIVIYIDKLQNIGEYFDSYGMEPLKTFKEFLNDNTVVWYRSQKILQAPFSSVCGQYCIFYVYHRCLGMSLNDIIYLLDVNNSDNIVNEFVKYRYTGMQQLEIYDYGFLYEQIADMFQPSLKKKKKSLTCLAFSLIS